LKELLRKRHTVSFFTTPEDLQARIMHDVPAQLSEMGVKVETKALEKVEEMGDRDLLLKFQMLPKLYSGRQVTIQFMLANIRSAFDEDCSALRLEHGATVTTHARDRREYDSHRSRRKGHSTDPCLNPDRIEGQGRANTAFGTYTQVIWRDDPEPIPETRGERGLVITQILTVDPPE
jgi:hypothetical protein